MTNRKRAVTALQGGEPDRVPLFELHIDSRVIEAICGDCSYEDFAEDYDLDIVMTGTPSDNYRMDVFDSSRRIYRDEWGVLRQFSEQTVSFPLEGPIAQQSDLDRYVPPDPLDPLRFLSLRRLVERFRGKRLIGMHVHDALSYPSYLRGMDTLMMDLIDNPELVHRLVEMAVQHSLSLMKRAREIGAELFVFGDDYAGTRGPLMSPDHFKTFFLPGLRRVVDAARAMNAFTVKHTDGNITPILDMIVETGIHGLHPLDPEAGMDIAKVKQRYGSSVCLIGNIDTGRILSESSPEEVDDEVRKTILAAAPGGGYIISSANSIHAKVRPENYTAMLRAARKYGRYDRLGEADRTSL
jgi:uroporphyrinogen decarboxylase